jgi:type II secretory pathway predicted ATPase ExeA
MDTISESDTDAFGDAVSPSLYVAREATERALAELVDCALEPARPVVLVGPPGVGKSLLLRLAGKRVDDVRARIFIPYPSLDPDDLCSWILNGLGSARFEDPVFAFEGYLGHLRETGSVILLMVDDVHAMPLETTRWLGRRTVTSKGEFRLIASALQGRSFEETIALLGPACETVLMESPMQPDESSHYIRERLRLSGALGSTRSRFDRTTVAELHRLSGGNPRELNAAAARLLRPSFISGSARNTARA